MAEFYDLTDLTGSILSGHSIKHLAAAAACFAIPITRSYELGHNEITAIGRSGCMRLCAGKPA